MERDAMAQLEAWRQSPRRKPLLLEGARQVGKSWLLAEFGRRAYANVAALDFELNPALSRIFDDDLDPARIIPQLQIAAGTSISPGSTLIILDEIQACPRAVTALKYFNERANEYHIACAGSLLGVAMHSGDSFPVGKVSFITIGPLSFTEFLRAVGRELLADALVAFDWSTLAPFHDRLIALLRDYMFVGGMPEPVAQFAQTHDYSQVRAVHDEILKAYDRDFSKHAPSDQVPRIRQVWQSIPTQLAKARRFAYRELAPGARSRTHGNAIEWLVDAGLVLRVERVCVPRLPLASYADESAFKLYLLDVGLLGALAGLSISTIIEGNRLFTEFKGSLTEQCAAEQLTAALGKPPFYWGNGGGTAEVDFVIQHDQRVVPVEVKATRNLKSQSLRVYREKYVPELAVRASLSPYARQGGIVDLPLYALWSLPALSPVGK